jgi:feruloyl-CoA synthase
MTRAGRHGIPMRSCRDQSDGRCGLVAGALARHNEGHGSAARVERLLIMTRPAALDAGEITDKGYVNQRKVLAERSALVERLYTDPLPPGVVVPAG